VKFRVDLTIEGYIKVEADSKEEARDKVEDGYSLSDVTVVDDEVDEITEIEPEE